MLAQLTEFANERIYSYHENRDRMDREGTSRLSAAFHLGLISAAQAVSLARRAIARAASPEARKGAETWLNELIWREFYQSILYHFPFVRRQAFREPYRAIQWIDDPDGFAAWQQGLTGYPIVDAAMRQLNTTGWMHNRARMIAASFLVKDLLIDWQWGEAYFMQQLVDGDVASNNGGWQWTAGVGTDAAPYFRIFNPVLQSKKFDPHGNYIRQYVPELSDVPEELIHEPWKMTPLEQQAYGVQLGSTYPQPIIDHAFARERTLADYGAVK
jgi:deoxyribodipyrimidine photo-lyase